MFKKILILAVLLTPLFYGCTENTPVTPSTNGVISGVVMDFETAVPLDNVFISTIPITTTVKTDAQGKFTLENLEPQIYKLVVEKSGYAAYIASISVLSSKTTQITVPLKLKSSDYATISGFVINTKDKNPLKDVNITVTPTPEDWTDVTTDASGFYLAQLPAGDYTIHFTKKDFKNRIEQISLAKNSKSNLDVEMEEGTSEETPDANLYVYYSFDTQFSGTTVKDNSGNNNNAQIVNDCQYVAGKFGSCLKTIEGSGSTGGWVKMNFTLPSNEFTINFWVKEVSAEYPGGQAYFQAGNNADGVCLIGRNGAWSNMNPIGDGLNYHFAVGANSSSSSNIPLAVLDEGYSPYSWNMFTMTYSNGKFYAYINGVLVGSKNQYFSVVESQLIGLGIQWWAEGQSTRFTALYDEFRIYTKQISQANIKNLFTKNSLN